MSLCLVRIFIWPLPRLPGEVGRGYGLGVPVQPSYPTPALPGERGGCRRLASDLEMLL
jgi:hypothetical protein